MKWSPALNLICFNIVLSVESECARAQHLYWTDSESEKVFRAETDGSNVTELFTASDQPLGIAIDPDARTVYWVDATERRVFAGHLVTGEVSELYTTDAQPFTLTLDRTRQMLYWTNLVDATIQWGYTDGSEKGQCRQFDDGYPVGIAVDALRNQVYWSSPSTQGGIIQRGNCGGDDPETLVSSLGSVTALAVDPDNEFIFWVDQSHRVLQRSDLDGNSITTIIGDGMQNPNGIAIDSDRGLVYWTDGDAGTIESVTYDGENRFDLGISNGTPRGVTIDTTGLAAFYASIDGDCPGQARLRILGCTPSGKVAIVFGTNPGEFENPHTVCNGIILSIRPPFPPGVPVIRQADENGELELVHYVPASHCGLVLVQAVDLSTCFASNLVTF